MTLHRKCPACNMPLIVPPTDECSSRDVHAAASETIVDWSEASTHSGYFKALKTAAEIAANKAGYLADQHGGRLRAKTATEIADAIRRMRRS